MKDDLYTTKCPFCNSDAWITTGIVSIKEDISSIRMKCTNVHCQAIIETEYDPEAEELKGKSLEEIQAIADADIEKINDEMPKYKRIKQTYLRTEPFEKTTTQKIKRRKIK